ncbi:MAG: hypothetical protein GY850_40650 [bacterium]|nr:hypothetical protein [bacterium]
MIKCYTRCGLRDAGCGLRVAGCEERKGYGAKSQAQGAVNDISVYPS